MGEGVTRIELNSAAALSIERQSQLKSFASYSFVPPCDCAIEEAFLPGTSFAQLLISRKLSTKGIPGRAINSPELNHYFETANAEISRALRLAAAFGQRDKLLELEAVR
jgi:hypothetical protein